MARALERQIIETARALIADPACWTQGEFARDGDGNPASWKSPRATRFCIWGALHRAAYDLIGDHRQSVIMTDRAACALRARGTSLSGDNDRGTHADALAVLDMYLRRQA